MFNKIQITKKEEIPVKMLKFIHIKNNFKIINKIFKDIKLMHQKKN